MTVILPDTSKYQGIKGLRKYYNYTTGPLFFSFNFVKERRKVFSWSSELEEQNSSLGRSEVLQDECSNW